jgi:hypothetical protein
MARGKYVAETSWTLSHFGQACAYAADGRPMTVAMPSADLLPKLRILLHLVLVGLHSALGLSGSIT